MAVEAVEYGRMGFTGSSRLVTPAQVTSLQAVLLRRAPRELVHGDCIMADELAHALTRVLVPSCHIIVAPPDKDDKRAFCRGDTIMPVASYLVRDEWIAQAAEYLIAVPDTDHMIIRSGAWTTVRRALSWSRVVTVIWPGGAVEENWKR